MRSMAFPGVGGWLLFAYAVASTFGLLLIKSALTGASTVSFQQALAMTSSFRFLAGFSLYLCSFLAWIAVLACMPLSTAYPLAIGLTMTGSTVGAAMLLREPMDLPKLVGIALVGTAVMCFSIGGRH